MTTKPKHSPDICNHDAIIARPGIRARKGFAECGECGVIMRPAVEKPAAAVKELLEAAKDAIDVLILIGRRDWDCTNRLRAVLAKFPEATK